MQDLRPPGFPDLRLGEEFGAYRLEAVIGEGAMGVVFRATREADGEIVALKVLKKVLSGNEVYRRRFLREARIAQEVRHNHLVPILEAAEAKGYDFLAMRYVEGGSLADRVDAEGALPLSQVVQLVGEIGAGLDALHARGIIHRDVKPSNVMLDARGRAALTDFGLAKGRAHTVLTEPGQMMGTLDYMPPEVIGGDEAGPPSDIYSLGCVVYECLTGVAPFSDRRLFQVAVAHLEADPPDPSLRSNAIPRQVGAVVARALAKPPADRPRTGTAFAHLLRSAARRRSRLSGS